MAKKADPEAILQSAGMALAGLEKSLPQARPTERIEPKQAMEPRKTGATAAMLGDDEAAIMAELETLKRKPTGRKLQANFRATPMTLLKLRRAAHHLRRSQADVLEEALELFLEKHHLSD